MIVFFILVLGSYFLLLLALLRGWSIAIAKSAEPAMTMKFISVLVPFRNEANHIMKLMHSIEALDYPSDKFEVIFINDHSEDDSVEVVQSCINDKSNHTQLNLSSSSKGKKEALTFGVASAHGEIIATTDADCELPLKWLLRINEAFQNEKIKMVFGGVRLNKPASFFSRLQAIEFSSLIGSGAASLSLGFFTMCNGANLAFRKSAFQFVNGYEGNLNIPSGDDEFLARKILIAFPCSLHFVNTKDTVVSTRPSSRMKEFIYQRLRWAGKWKYNPSIFSRILAIYVMMVQLSFLGVLASVIALKMELSLLLPLIGVKVLLEWWFLYRLSKFLSYKWSWSAFFTLQFVYPLYVLGIGIVSYVTTYEWKGRRLSHKM